MIKKRLKFMFSMIYELALNHMSSIYKDEMYDSEFSWDPSLIFNFAINEIEAGRLIEASIIINYVAMSIENFVDDDALDEIMLFAVDSYNERISA